jgi:nicotinate-nucleotide pyrophosphorylase (carboxylating)
MNDEHPLEQSLRSHSAKLEFEETERAAARTLIDLALAEDLADVGDLTCGALIGEGERGEVQVVSRQSGLLAGVPVAEMVLGKLDPSLRWTTQLPDGSLLQPGSVVAKVRGPWRSLLTGERTVLNFLTHLSGIATLTRAFVDAVAGTQAKILDTRKTLPGYRVLEKYAVRAGGGCNHRMGLFDGILIKDNHLAALTAARTDATIVDATIVDAIRQARNSVPSDIPVEVEVDSLEQLTDALAGSPDMVLLDNMDTVTLRKAVELRNATALGVQLEASGGISLDTVAEIAATGVERISIGALTHSAAALDLAFDWNPPI